MSIIKNILTNQIADNDIIIVMMPSCPGPTHIIKRNEFTKFDYF